MRSALPRERAVRHRALIWRMQPLDRPVDVLTDMVRYVK